MNSSSSSLRLALRSYAKWTLACALWLLMQTSSLAQSPTPNDRTAPASRAPSILTRALQQQRLSNDPANTQLPSSSPAAQESPTNAPVRLHAPVTQAAFSSTPDAPVNSSPGQSPSDAIEPSPLGGQALDSVLAAAPTEWFTQRGLPNTLKMMGLLTILSVAPAILLMTTCYVRVIIVFGLLKQALGAQQLPPAQVTTAISLFITLFVMSPVWTRVYHDAIEPYTAEGSTMTAEDAWEKGTAPIRTFMAHQIAFAKNYDDVHLFYSRYAPNSPTPTSFDDVPLQVLLPAYMLSELKTACLIGFQIYLPFLVLDLVIAAVTSSMGLSLAPSVIAMPSKLLLFVLVDGWHLVAKMLLDSFGTFPSG